MNKFQNISIAGALFFLGGFVPLELAYCQQNEREMRTFRFNRSAMKDVAPEKQAEEAPVIKSDPRIKIGISPGEISESVKKLAQEGANQIAFQKWGEAVVTYEKMVKKDPQNPLAFANLGVAQHHLMNETKDPLKRSDLAMMAEKNLTRSVQLNPRFAHNWTTLGLIQFGRGDRLLALSSLARAVRADPKSSKAHLYLAAVTYELGWIHATIESLSRVVELEPENAEAQYNLALTYLALNPPKIELARRHYHNSQDLGANPSTSIEKILNNSAE